MSFFCLNSVMAPVSPTVRPKVRTMASKSPQELASCSISASFPSAHTLALYRPHQPCSFSFTTLVSGPCVRFLLYMDVLYPDIHKANALSSFSLLLKCHLISKAFPDHCTAHVYIIDKTMPPSTSHPLKFLSFATATI